MTCPRCEYNKLRAARWRAEAYKLSGYDGIELPWVGLTDEEIDQAWRSLDYTVSWAQHRIDIAQAIEAKLKEKNT